LVLMARTARMARGARVVVAASRVSADDVVRYLEVSARRVEVLPWAADPAMAPPAGVFGGQGESEGLSPPPWSPDLRYPTPRYRPSRYIVMAGGFAHHDPRKRYEDAAPPLLGIPWGRAVYGAR